MIFGWPQQIIIGTVGVSWLLPRSPTLVDWVSLLVLFTLIMVALVWVDYKRRARSFRRSQPQSIFLPPSHRDFHKVGHQHVTFKDGVSLAQFMNDLDRLHGTTYVNVDLGIKTAYFQAIDGGAPPSVKVRQLARDHGGAWGDDPPQAV